MIASAPADFKIDCGGRCYIKLYLTRWINKMERTPGSRRNYRKIHLLKFLLFLQYILNGTFVLAPEGIIQPDVTFYTQVQPCNGKDNSPKTDGIVEPNSRLPTPCKPLEPAYQPMQLLTITTVRLPYLTSDLALPPGYVSLREAK
ncbi:uncharacterized protein LOC118192827 [Stegodyphus dumicola]|uniref:uncharacterized protein LOC118192827 n=1 Tax=Stegodyphus dumicola TaxID=202533 RepID=UPI0015AAA47C|nr:uncharacterized protein LOC118192827 [Stegodyphus dumicola]